MLNLYVTSTERKAGKTFVSAGIAATMQGLGYSTTVYKPIQTCGIEKAGFMQSPDLTYIKTLDPYISTQFTYLYKDDAEPMIASEAENNFIDVDLIENEYKKLLPTSECLIVDGVGGILSPIAPNIQVADMVRRLSLPMLIVTTPNNNAVNDTLLTISVAQEKGITIRGVVINLIDDNCSKTLMTSIPRVIEEYTNVKIVGLIPKIEKKEQPEEIITSILNGIDIESVFNVKIEKLDMN